MRILFQSCDEYNLPKNKCCLILERNEAEASNYEEQDDGSRWLSVILLSEAV